MKTYQLPPSETVNLGQLSFEGRNVPVQPKLKKQGVFVAQYKKNTIDSYLSTLSKTVKDHK